MSPSLSALDMETIDRLRDELRETRKALAWAADRLVYVYDEDPHVDYIRKMRALARPENGIGGQP